MPGPKTSEFTIVPEVAVEYPAPRIPARLTRLEDCPGGAKAKMRKAKKAGLDVTAHYAFGPWVEADGVKWKWKHSLLVRFVDPSTGEVLAGAHWLANVFADNKLPPEPRYGVAEWVRQVASMQRDWKADWVIIAGSASSQTMKDLDTWLADRAAE